MPNLKVPGLSVNTRSTCRSFTHAHLAQNSPSIIICLHYSHLFTTPPTAALSNVSAGENGQLCPVLSRLYPSPNLGLLLLRQDQASFEVFYRGFDVVDTGGHPGETSTDLQNPSSFALAGEGHLAHDTSRLLGRISSFLSRGLGRRSSEIV